MQQLFTTHEHLGVRSSLQ